jgi:hypothetical protein
MTDGRVEVRSEPWLLRAVVVVVAIFGVAYAYLVLGSPVASAGVTLNFLAGLWIIPVLWIGIESVWVRRVVVDRRGVEFQYLLDKKRFDWDHLSVWEGKQSGISTMRLKLLRDGRSPSSLAVSRPQAIAIAASAPFGNPIRGLAVLVSSTRQSELGGSL